MTPGWRHVTRRFATFLTRLQAGEDEHRRAAAAAAEVAKLLRLRFASGPVTTEPPIEPMMIGGFQKRTALRHAPCVDLLFVLPDHYRTDRSPAARTGLCSWAGGILEMASVLVGRFGAVASSRDGWLTVDVSARPAGPTASPGTTAGKMKVRIVPAFLSGAGGLLVPARGGAPGNSPWRRTAPLSELAHLDHADALADGKARDLVRIAKAWRLLSGAAIAPLALELLACEFSLIWVYRRRSALFYDWMVRDFFFWLAAQGKRELRLPGTDEIVRTGDGWQAAAEHAWRFAAEAADLERDNRESDAIACWCRVFGDRFGRPRPEPEPPSPGAAGAVPAGDGAFIAVPAATGAAVPWRALVPAAEPGAGG